MYLREKDSGTASIIVRRIAKEGRKYGLGLMVISQRPADECQRLVKSMVDPMEHEPSYDSGMYSVPETGIYAGWVAHEDSFAVGQPFFN